MKIVVILLHVFDDFLCIPWSRQFQQAREVLEVYHFVLFCHHFPIRQMELPPKRNALLNVPLFGTLQV